MCFKIEKCNKNFLRIRDYKESQLGYERRLVIVFVRINIDENFESLFQEKWEQKYLESRKIGSNVIILIFQEYFDGI